LQLDILGTVEDFQCPLFDPEPKATIPIRCFQPDLIDNRILSIEDGTVSDSTNIVIEYPGTIETGVVLTLELNRDLPEFTMYNMGEDGILQQVDFSYPLLDGDRLVVSSLTGSKGITLTRDGVSSSALYGRTSQSGWIELSEGDNLFRVYAPGDPVPYTLEYSVRYGGV
jgi:hypothetical protein